MQTDQPDLIGIVVPAYNAAAYLAETLDSVRAQTYFAWHCVVVDDGSSDETRAIATRYVAADGRFSLVSQANAGLPSARNAGIAAMPEDVVWLAFLDSDDTWLPDALTDLTTMAAAREDAVGIYGLAEYMNSLGSPIRAGAHPKVQRDRRTLGRVDLVDLPHGADTDFDSIIVSGTIWPPAVGLFRREVVEQAGRFDPSQRFVEDWDLWVRMARFGPFVPVDRQVAWYRQHDTNMTKRADQMAYYHARVRWNIWRSQENTARQRRVAQQVWLRLQLRWVLWTAVDTARAIRNRDSALARDTWRACRLFVRKLLVGHPVEPDRRTARHIARFIASRQAGDGLDHLQGSTDQVTPLETSRPPREPRGEHGR